jgi:hypothetical protein
MADYEYNGLRKKLSNNTSKKLCRLDDLGYERPVIQRKVREGLKQYYEMDIMAIYAANTMCKISSNLVNTLFIRGTLESINPHEDELIFKGLSGIIEPQRIAYQGSTWILPISQLIDVESISEYMADPYHYNRPYPLREFEFGTMSGIRIGEVRAYNPLGAFLSIIQQYTPLQKELSKGPTTPIRLLSIKSIKDIVKEDKREHSGTGTGKGFVM